MVQKNNRNLRPETILTTENPLEMMENAFYFMLKAFFVLEIFKVFFEFLVIQKNFLNLISKFMTSHKYKYTY